MRRVAKARIAKTPPFPYLPARMRLAFSFFALLSFLAVSTAAAMPPHMGARERSELRYRLQDLFNEVDLLIKNRKVDFFDLRKQDRDFEALKVFERIPFEEDIAGLRAALVRSAGLHHLKMKSFKVIGRSHAGHPIPRAVFTDGKEFHLSEDQLAERIRFKVRVRGDIQDVIKWVDGWRDEQMRLSVAEAPVSPLKDGDAVVVARAFRFRDIRFPMLFPRNPITMLPRWAQRNPGLFAREEPLLWRFVTGIKALAPRARPYYDNRSRFLLNGARMDFFLSKTRAGAS